ncbi:MAG TPA: hypothetical protein VM012_05365 [Flavitalea sp.]|nr:hypothetical protein [Flavitalea sp.]
MQFIIKRGWLLLFVPFITTAQSTYLPQGSKHQLFIERLEIMLQKNPDLNLSTVKPVSRRIAVNAALYSDSAISEWSKSDQYNLTSLLMNNREWVDDDRPEFISAKNLWKTFYRTKANLLEVNQPDFFLAVNPVIQQQQSLEGDNEQRIFVNSKGLTFRGLISKKLGFSAYLTDNQERAPRFVQSRINEFKSVPGAGFYKTFKTTAVDYFDARGTIHFNAAKYLDFQFGYDKLFIGSGYRSLFLSDFGNSFLFLRINTKIWKLNYQNIFAELTPQYIRGGADNLLDKKYAAMHHLSMNVTSWLNLGVFESVIFGRKNHFDFAYLNPIIFLRVAEQQNGSFDNAVVGIDWKANVARRFQFYGQLMLDEFLLKELRAGNGWWGNKFGLQVGGKYINVFGVDNLDIQGEINVVRPFTYSHNDSVANYTHYNQPLAHPLGANFIEAIGIVRFQPFPKWSGTVRLIGWKQGIDTGSSNYGANIFKANTTRSGNYGFSLPSGIDGKAINMQFLVSYEWKENLFLESALLYRKQSAPEFTGLNRNTTLLTLGIRWNMFRREYDY